MSHSSNTAVSRVESCQPSATRQSVRAFPAPVASGKSDLLRVNIARSMIGRSVDLLVDAKSIVHGVVRGVFTEAGRPKLVVGDTIYDPHQVLIVTPTTAY